MLRLVTLSCFIFLACSTASAQIKLEAAFPGLTFSRPVDFQHANDGSGRLFVVEQGGVIRVFDNVPSVAGSGVFLDIKGRIDARGNEEGLLGLAFHPLYASNGYFYVNYTATSPDRTVISRFSVSPTDPYTADPNSELVLIEFSQPFSNHNGGQLAFGSDGYLYIATGDGGSGGDPQNNSQNLASLLGKILRIDIDRASGGRNYSIPPDNPYANSSEGYRAEIWAHGMRNPWRFSFDPVSGKLWAGDVGQNLYEEIDIIEGGKNYGWRIMEAMSCFNPSTGCDQTGLELPVWSYGRSEGQSVTGGHVYRGLRNPELDGVYIYADFVTGTIWGLSEDGGTYTNEVILHTGLNISSFGVDEDRELYFCAFDGSVYHFISGVTSADHRSTPERITVSEFYPNPVHAEMQSVVQVSLPERSHIRAVLYDVLGRACATVAASDYPAGTHALRVDTSTLPSGIYILGITTKSGMVNRRLVAG